MPTPHSWGIFSMLWWDSNHWHGVCIPQGCCSGAEYSAKELIPQREALNHWPPRSWCINIPTPSPLRWKFLRCVLCIIFPYRIKLYVSFVVAGWPTYSLPVDTLSFDSSPTSLPYSLNFPSKLFHWNSCLRIPVSGRTQIKTASYFIFTIWAKTILQHSYYY